MISLCDLEKTTDKSKGLTNYLADLAVNSSPDKLDEDLLKEYELEIITVGKLYHATGNDEDLRNLIETTLIFMKQISKAKASKLVTMLIDMYLDMEAVTAFKVQLCKDSITWAEQEKISFLRQSLEARLIALYYDSGLYVDSLNLTSQLLSELKKINDKNLLVEVQLLESKTYYSLSNLLKAKAALISARTTANSIYVPPKIQGDLDLQAGLLHASDDNDFKTSYSYFIEAFEQYDSVDDSKAKDALKYMLLCKIILNETDDVDKILSGKIGLKYFGRDVEAMRAISVASKNRSIDQFKMATNKYQSQLKEDKNVLHHLDILYDELVERNLCKIIEPYSAIQIDYVANKIGLLREEVEKKLSQMILDKKIYGVLDQCPQGNALILFSQHSRDKTCDDVILSIAAMNGVVDRLYKTAKKLVD